VGKKRSISKKVYKSYLPSFLILFSIISVVTILGMAARWELSRNTPEPPNPMRMRGRSDAPIKIIEYADLQCEPCAEGAQKLKEYMKAHPDDISLEFKHFPLENHKNSLRAAIYSECAGRQGKFWTFVDKLFEQQDKWKNLINADGFFGQTAYDLRINKSQLFQCIANPEIKQAILKQKERGEFLDIDTVPTYYINQEIWAGDEGLIEKIKEFSGNK
jgi:protein-disulfide isomerase